MQMRKTHRILVDVDKMSLFFENTYDYTNKYGVTVTFQVSVKFLIRKTIYDIS